MRDGVIKIPSFHVWGSADQLVENWRSDKLSKIFQNAITHVHSSDHFIKAIKQWPFEKIKKFIKDNLTDIDKNECIDSKKVLRTEFTDI